MGALSAIRSSRGAPTFIAGLASAEESYEVERLRFESGTSTMAELLDALDVLHEARLCVTGAAQYRQDSAARLKRAVGGVGWR